VRNELGIGGEVSGRTLNRAVETVGRNMQEMLSRLRDSLFRIYDLEHTDVNVDTTSVSVYSKQTGFFNFGYSRDKRPDLRQVNVGVVELRDPINIPFHMAVGEGNTADPVQFARMVDEIVNELRKNSMFVFDAGGDAKQVLDVITEKDMRYVTRKKMNASDDKWISQFKKENLVLEEKDNKIWCQRKKFESSGRTVYLFFSEKLYKDKIKALDSKALRCVQDARETMRMKADGTLRVSKTVVKRMRNPLISINVGVQGRFFSDDTEAFEYVRNELSNGREGFFKLECSENLTPSEVLRIYRKRDTVEKLIESLKNHIDLKPLRVWSDHSVEGTLLLCFLAQTIVSMARYEVPRLRQRSTKFIIGSLQNLTATYVYDNKQAVRRIYSNFEPINSLILRDTVIVSGVCGG
jgi:transposase